MPQLYLYASVREQLSDSDWSVVAAGGGSMTTGGTLNLYLQSQNRAGLNLLSNPKPITWTVGQKVTITINNSARNSGEEIFYFTLSGETTGNAINAIQLAQWRAKDLSQITNRNLPATIELTRDSHLSTIFTIASANDFPASPVQGMVRQLAGQFYKYDVEAETGAYQSGSGYWVEVSGNSTYLADTTDPSGCDRSITLLTAANIITPPLYAGDGSDSTPIKYWLLNGFNELDNSIPIGSLFDLQVKINDSIADGLTLSGKVKCRVIGLVRRSTGQLDTNFDEAGETFIWESEAGHLFPLSTEIPSGYALAIEITFNFLSLEIKQTLSADSTAIQVIPYIKGKFGTLEPAWYFYGDSIPNEGSRMRIIPSLSGIKRLAGTCLIQKYLATINSEEIFTYNLQVDTDNQQIALNAALGGEIIIRSPSETLSANEALRAKISTLPGEKLSAWSETIALSNQALQLTITHPCDTQGEGTIRSDYPDSAIAGNNKGSFNLFYLRIYLQVGTAIYRQNTPIAATIAPQQTVTISDLTGFTSIGSLPEDPDNWFDLWECSPPTLSVTTPGTLSGAIKAIVSHYYPSPNLRITKISHRIADGCIPEIDLSLIEIVNTLKYWGNAYRTKNALKSLNSSTLTEGQVRLVLENSSAYHFALVLGQADDGDNYLACDDVPSRGWIKIAPVPQLSANTLAGRTLTNGEIQPISLGTGLAFAGTTLIATGGSTGTLDTRDSWLFA